MSDTGWSDGRSAEAPGPVATGSPAGPEPLDPDPAPADAGTTTAVATEQPPARRRSSGMRSLIEWLVIIAVALIGAVVIRTVLFQAFFIPSASMTPTLKVHDRILVNKLSYDLHPVHRGDIVVFKRSPNMAGTEGGIKDLVKRVIGLPGETITTTADGRVAVDGKALGETYLPAGTLPGPAITRAAGCLPGPPNACTIPPGHYFVMGDNRDDSSDSRVFGPITKGQIVGRAFVLIWPLPDFGLL